MLYISAKDETDPNKASSGALDGAKVFGCSVAKLQGSTYPMQIKVGKWLKLYNVNFLYVTAVVYSDESTIFEEPGSDTGATIHGPSHHPLALVRDVPVR